MIKLKAYAKLNLSLNIIPHRLKNGLYPVKFINCQIELHDQLYFEKKTNNVEFFCSSLDVPKKEDNIIYKAALLLKKIINQQKLGAKITLQKNIPIKAGLGGGSSDAAATLIGLAKLWNIKLTQNMKFFLAEKLGKDVHYCLTGKLCEVREDGSTIIPLNLKMPKFWLVIVSPEEKKPSTKFMYENLNSKEIGKNLYKFNKLKKAIQKKARGEILDNLSNDFEDLAIRYFPIIKKIKSDILKEGALKTLLAGSGLSVLGFFNSKFELKKAVNNLKLKYKNVIWTSTL